MKKIKFHKKIVVLAMMLGIALMVASCGPNYVRSGYGFNNGYGRPYGYGYSRPRPYRYYAPPVVVVPRYAPPSRRGNYGGGYGRTRRW